MVFHIICNFPDSFRSYFETSIPKNAMLKWVYETRFYNLWDYSDSKTRRIDDRPYGWLPWTIIKAPIIAKALDEILEKNEVDDIIFLWPRWNELDQETLEDIAYKSKDMVLICWHYEGIDERIMELYDIKTVSIGKYVLSSWELAAMVLMDWIIRLLPWVLNPESLREESFSDTLGRKKEYPQYTRPEEYKWLKVPAELLSWDPKKIEAWKKRFIK